MTDQNGLNGRQLYVPRGQDPIEDLNLLADAIAASNAGLFDQGGHPMWVNGTGGFVAVNPATLLGIITRNVVTKHAINRAGNWEVEYRPFEPDEMTLRTLLSAKTLAEGGLARRLPKAPSEPVKLSEQQRREINMRLQVGEPKDRIADAYGVNVDMIKQLVR